MKKIAYPVLVLFVLSSVHTGAQSFDNLNKSIDNAQKDVEKEYNKLMGKNSGTKALTNDEVIGGLREALSVGTNNSASSASKADGYFKNPLIFIPFPPEAEKVKNTVVNLGMQKQVDDFVMTMNRAAEEAAKEAAPVFLEAIKGMSISDGFAILNGSDSAATGYLEKSTSSQLTTKFTPIIKKAIEKVEVTRYWNPIITTYNKVPGVAKQEPDLEKYITAEAMDGLFKLIAIEEKRIRDNPAARVTDLLKKVFAKKKK